MRIDWCDGESCGVVVPWNHEERAYMKGKTHYWDYDLVRRDRSSAISAAVKRYTYDTGETPWPSGMAEGALFSLHRGHRDRIWRALYAKGYRVVKLKVRAA